MTRNPARSKGAHEAKPCEQAACKEKTQPCAEAIQPGAREAQPCEQIWATLRTAKKNASTSLQSLFIPARRSARPCEYMGCAFLCPVSAQPCVLNVAKWSLRLAVKPCRLDRSLGDTWEATPRLKDSSTHASSICCFTRSLQFGRCGISAQKLV